MDIKIVKWQKKLVINIHFPSSMCYNQSITSEGKRRRFFETDGYIG